MLKEVPVATVNRVLGWFSVARVRDDFVIPAERRIGCGPQMAVALEGGTIFTEILFGRFRDAQAGSQIRVMIVAVVMALPAVGIGAVLANAQSAPATATADACPPATPTSGTPTPTQCVEIGEYDIYYKPNLATLPA